MTPEELPQIVWGWDTIAHPDPTIFQLHVMPLYDTGMHAFDGGCPCCPVEDPLRPGLFHHVAFDGRERYELGLAKPH